MTPGGCEIKPWGLLEYAECRDISLWRTCWIEHSTGWSNIGRGGGLLACVRGRIIGVPEETNFQSLKFSRIQSPLEQIV